MDKKKLLTLVGVVGILACGACYLPPLPQHKYPLPPALSSVHKIAVQVEDGAAGNLFDPLIMSKATADNFNALWQEFPVRAETFNAGGPSDTTLRITVLRKTVSCTPINGKPSCSYEMIASFTLTTADGRILQSRSQASSKFGLWYQGNSLPKNLNANPFRQEAAYALAMTAGEMLFYTRSQ